MKNYLLTFSLALSMVFFVSVSSQAQSFQTGDMVANAGLGFGWYSYGYGISSFPAISASLERGITQFDMGSFGEGILGVGGIVGYKHASYNWSFYGEDYKWAWNDIFVAARGSVHANLFKVDKLDTYGGLAVGLRFQSWKHNDSFSGNSLNDTEVHGVLAVYAGSRYYFTEKVSVFGEVGYGLGYLTLGLSLKI